MKSMKRILCALLAVLLLTCLSACGDKDKKEEGALEEDLAALVQGKLDELYLGQYSESFLSTMGVTAEDCQQEYQENLEINAEYFARYFEIDNLTDELKAELVEFYKELFSKAQYTVGEVSQIDETNWAVNVALKPIDLPQQMLDGWDEWMEPFRAKYAGADFDTMGESVYQKADAEWARYAIDLAKDRLQELSYRDEEALAVQVIQNEDGSWTISENDIYTIDDYIVYFPVEGTVAEG